MVGQYSAKVLSLFWELQSHFHVKVCMVYFFRGASVYLFLVTWFIFIMFFFFVAFKKTEKPKAQFFLLALCVHTTMSSHTWGSVGKEVARKVIPFLVGPAVSLAGYSMVYFANRPPRRVGDGAKALASTCIFFSAMEPSVGVLYTILTIGYYAPDAIASMLPG